MIGVGSTMHRRRQVFLVGGSVLFSLLATGCTGSDETPSRSAATASSAPSASSTASTPSSAPVSTPPSSSRRPNPPRTSSSAPPGDIHSTVPSRVQPSRKPVPLSSAASTPDVSARISDIRVIQAQARGPGEISGPSYEVTFVIRNRSDRPLDLSSVTANLQDATGRPSVSLTGPPAAPFTETVAAGARAKGVYVFRRVDEEKDPITVTLSYSADAPIVVFTGTVR